MRNKTTAAFAADEYREHYLWIDHLDQKQKRASAFLIMLIGLLYAGEEGNLPLINNHSTRIKNQARQMNQRGNTIFMTGPIPAAAWLRAYERAWLRSDLVAGLTAAAVVVPQAMAYADIAGLPLAVGLYTALVPLVVYAVMGTSRPLSVTTTSTLAILTAVALHAIAPPGANDSVLISTTATLAFLVGGILLVASILRLGIVASFISEPVLVGFKAGVGLVIVVDQVPKLMGVHFDKGHFFHNLVSIVDHLPQASVATILLALAMLTLQIGLQRFLPRVPASLVTVAAGILASSLAGFNRLGIELVGEVHGGLPAFVLPNISLFPHLWPAAVGIALMSFVEMAAAGRAFRGADEPQPEANRELLALGLTNLIGGLFQNMPSGGGTSQTAVNRSAGARSQVAGLVTAVGVVAVLLFLAPLIHLMPQATLAAVVAVSCAGMIHPQEFHAILRTRVMEFSWAIASLVGVVLLGTLNGILVAVFLSLLALTYHANRHERSNSCRANGKTRRSGRIRHWHCAGTSDERQADEADAIGVRGDGVRKGAGVLKARATISWPASEVANWMKRKVRGFLELQTAGRGFDRGRRDQANPKGCARLSWLKGTQGPSGEQPLALLDFLVKQRTKKRSTRSRMILCDSSSLPLVCCVCYTGLIKLLSTSYVAGRHPASAQSSPLTAAFVTIKQMASAISSGLISRFNCVCGSTLVRMYSSPSARTIGVSVNPGWITLQRTP